MTTPLRPAYLLLGSESYFRDRFRAQMLQRLPEQGREFSLNDEDLSSTPLELILDRARTPSLMAPLQMFFIRGVKDLFSRNLRAAEPEEGESKPAGKRKHGDFPANLAAFVKLWAGQPPSATLIFIADHIEIPAERARISLDDKTRLQRLEDVFGPLAEIVWCQRVEVGKAAALARQMAANAGAEITSDAAHLLAEATESNLALIEREIEKLANYSLPETRITKAAVEEMASAGGRPASAFELAQAIVRQDPAPILAMLRRIWEDEGDGAGIGLVFMLARIFKMALVLKEAKARDVRALYNVLPDGMRPPGFAAPSVLAVSQRMPEAQLWKALSILHRVDIGLRSSPDSAKLLVEDAIFQINRKSAEKNLLFGITGIN